METLLHELRAGDAWLTVRIGIFALTIMNEDLVPTMIDRQSSIIYAMLIAIQLLVGDES